MLALLREISLRHWAKSPLRTLLVILGISLGVALHVATESAAGSMLSAFTEFVTRVSGRADLTIEREGAGVPAELVPVVSEVPGVAHVASSLELTVQAPELHESLLVLGVDFLGDLHFLPFKDAAGEAKVVEDPLAFVNDPTAILVARRFATRHKLGTDSRVSLLTADGPKDFFVRGILEDSGPAASFGGQVAVMFIDAAQVSFARGTLVDRIDVALAPEADKAAVRAAIQKAAGEELSVEAPDRIGMRLRALTEPLRAGLATSGFLALLVGAFLVYNAVGVAVAQRSREIGILRALGLTRRRVTALFCLEAAMVSAPGIALGLALGQVLSRYSTATVMETLNQFFAPVAPVEAKLTPTLIMKGIGAGFVTSVFAAWWPARRGAAVDPAVVLRGSSSVERTPVPTGKLFVAGTALLVVAWLPIPVAKQSVGGWAMLLTVAGAACVTPTIVIGMCRGLVKSVEAVLGLPARLGLDYVERMLARSTVSVLALMVAVSLSVSVGGWLASFERSLSTWAEQVGVADLVVTQGSPILDRRHVPLSPEAVDRIARVPGIEGVQSFRIVEQGLNGRRFRLVATDTDPFLRGAAKRGKGGWPIAEGEPLEPGELSGSRKIVLADNAARLFGLHVGDKIKLRAAKKDVEFEVRAIIIDYTAQDGTGFIDRKHYLEHWGDGSVDSMTIYLDDPGKAEQVTAGIRAALGGGGAVFVSGMSGLKEQLLETLPRLFAYSRSVEIVTLLIALMGVVGTMVAAVIDRAREIGTLRAIGASPGQVATAVVVEAGFLGVCAVAAGIGLGGVECLIFLKRLFASNTGWHLDFVFPWTATLRIGGLVIGTSALAGGLPALRAARADAKNAVVYE